MMRISHTVNLLQCIIYTAYRNQMDTHGASKERHEIRRCVTSEIIRLGLNTGIHVLVTSQHVL